MAGAGVASADGADTNGAANECTEAAAASNSSTQINIPVNVGVSVFGDVTQSNTAQQNSAQANQIQQICQNGDDNFAANVAGIGVEQANNSLNLLDNEL
ncbi:hypothetical protein J7E93_17125 [Streptomyces sp. ISL-36]|uniref:hypothetical protein n=1 Tax=Streptomyces sp. ISL-36 TaxID=2819182 RepID=UPI001BE964CD|nr:hypothetical protein [Streptomyces sp. ISL-36]MBT2441802.1 hypothetical protein [Streptomyces sp. ISL-36]